MEFGSWELWSHFFYQVFDHPLVRHKGVSLFFSDDKEEDKWYQRCLLSFNLCNSGVESKAWYNLQIFLLFLLWNTLCINSWLQNKEKQFYFSISCPTLYCSNSFQRFPNNDHCVREKGILVFKSYKMWEDTCCLPWHY